MGEYYEITFIRGVPIFLVFVGRLIHEIKRIQRTMKLRKQFDIDILANAVLD